MENLKIYPYLENIWKSIQNNKITIINSSTGTGKSIGIPQYFLKLYYDSFENFDYRKLFVSVPTILNVKELCKYANQICPYGNEFGFITGDNRTENVFSKNVIYGTTRSIFNRLLRLYRENDLENIIIMIDEAHHPSVENYILMSFCNFLIKKNYNIKIIITTATPVINEDFDYLQTNNVFTIDVRQYKINIVYGDLPDTFYITMPDIAYTIRDTIENIKDNKDILIFVDGSKSASVVKKILSYTMEKENVIHILYSNMSDNQKRKIYNYTNKRKIIIATNTVENGITIPGIGHVIDTLKYNIKIHNKLITNLISKQSSIQRMGRTGRTFDGYYYPLVTEEAYNKDIVDTKENNSDFYTTDPILYILDFLKNNLNPIDILKIDEEKYNEHIEYLKSVKIINDNLKVNNPEILNLRLSSINEILLLNFCIEQFKKIENMNNEDAILGYVYIIINITGIVTRINNNFLLYYDDYNKKNYINELFKVNYKGNNDLEILNNIVIDVFKNNLPENIPFRQDYINNIRVIFKNIINYYFKCNLNLHNIINEILRRKKNKLDNYFYMIDILIMKCIKKIYDKKYIYNIINSYDRIAIDDVNKKEYTVDILSCNLDNVKKIIAINSIIIIGDNYDKSIISLIIPIETSLNEIVLQTIGNLNVLVDVMKNKINKYLELELISIKEIKLAEKILGISINEFSYGSFKLFWDIITKIKLLPPGKLNYSLVTYNELNKISKKSDFDDIHDVFNKYFTKNTQKLITIKYLLKNDIQEPDINKINNFIFKGDVNRTIGENLNIYFTQYDTKIDDDIDKLCLLDEINSDEYNYMNDFEL